MTPPPSPISTPRLVLRCWRPPDAPALREALASSAGSLSRWLPWAAAEPSPTSEIRKRLEVFAENFSDGRDFVYGIFARTGGGVLGGTGLHPRNDDDDREIGYWLRDSATGHGFAVECVRALTSTAFAHWPNLRTVTIVCDPANVRSAAVAARAGFVCQGNFPAKAPMPGRKFDQLWQAKRSVPEPERSVIGDSELP